MGHRTDRVAFGALQSLVDNTLAPEDGPLGGTDIRIRFNADRSRYEVGIEAGETGGFGAAPTLAMALIAASYADEGEAVYLGPNGEWLCPWCVDATKRCAGGCKPGGEIITAKVGEELRDAAELLDA